MLKPTDVCKWRVSRERGRGCWPRTRSQIVSSRLTNTIGWLMNQVPTMIKHTVTRLRPSLPLIPRWDNPGSSVPHVPPPLDLLPFVFCIWWRSQELHPRCTFPSPLSLSFSLSFLTRVDIMEREYYVNLGVTKRMDSQSITIVLWWLIWIQWIGMKWDAHAYTQTKECSLHSV